MQKLVALLATPKQSARSPLRLKEASATGRLAEATRAAGQYQWLFETSVRVGMIAVLKGHFRVNVRCDICYCFRMTDAKVRAPARQEAAFFGEEVREQDKSVGRFRFYYG